MTQLATALQDRKQWLSAPVVNGLVRFADCLVVLGAWLLANFSRFEGFVDVTSIEVYLLLIGALIVSQGFELAGLYRPEPVIAAFRPLRLILAWSVVMLLLVSLGFLTKTGQEISRLWMALWFVYALAGLVTARLVFQLQVERHDLRDGLVSNLAIVGSPALARRFADQLQRQPDPLVRLVGLFADGEDPASDEPVSAGRCPILGGPDDLIPFARRHHVDRVVVAVPWNREDRLVGWMRRLRNLPVEILLCPEVIVPSLADAPVTRLGGVPLFTLSERPLSGWNYVIKRAEDHLLASFLVIFFGPLMLLIALAIRLDSPGPALFRQKRWGFASREFEVLKFRTMVVGAAQAGQGTVTQATRDDPRVTRVGRWLRRTSLDELPQLFNVLRGDMSLVGPRPLAVSHNEQYAGLIDLYMARHRVKPGITGFAQIHGYRGETDTLEKMERRVHYDLRYVDEWSVLLDLKILARTALVGFVHPNAY